MGWGPGWCPVCSGVPQPHPGLSGAAGSWWPRGSPVSLPWSPHQVQLSKPSTRWALALVLFLWQQPGSFARDLCFSKERIRCREGGARRLRMLSGARASHPRSLFSGARQASSPCPGPVGEEAR